MSRYSILALAAAVAAVVTFAVVQTGTSQVVGVSTAQAASKLKVCKSKLPNGQTKSWRCAADQACCVNKELGLYVCGFAGLGCL